MRMIGVEHVSQAKTMRMFLWGIWVVMSGLLIIVSTIIAAAERSDEQQ